VLRRIGADGIDLTSWWLPPLVCLALSALPWEAVGGVDDEGIAIYYGAMTLWISAFVLNAILFAVRKQTIGCLVFAIEMDGYENRVIHYVLGLIVRCWLVVPLLVACCFLLSPGFVVLLVLLNYGTLLVKGQLRFDLALGFTARAL